jgi:hypothetical protein
MNQFSVGDRVLVVRKQGINDYIIGMEGTVTNIPNGYNYVNVRFDEKIKYGHTADGTCQDGYGYNLEFRNIMLAQNINVVFNEEEYNEIMLS